MVEGTPTLIDICDDVIDICDDVIVTLSPVFTSYVESAESL
jgi:hypothetical protein